MIDIDLNSISKEDLINQIKNHNRLYRAGEAIIDDADYDVMIAHLRSIDPSNEWFQSIEPSDIKEYRKVKLPIPMRSLNKIHDMTGLGKWVKYLGLHDNTQIVIMPKFDGVSLLVDEINDRAYSRGGSENEGQDCTPHFNKTKCVNNNSSFNFSFGEFIFSKDNWERFFKSRVSENTGKVYKSSRNTIAGLINSDSASALLEHAYLYRYGISEEDMKRYTSFDEALRHINSEYKQIGMFKLLSIKDLSEEYLLETYEKWSKEYQIDGIVIYLNDTNLWRSIGRNQSTGNPLYAIAYKSPNFSQLFETTVLSVNWRASKAGALKPTVAIDEIDTGDCSMTNPTGYNAGWINNMNIARGAKVLVIRSGGVIPKIIKVITPPLVHETNSMWDDLTECPHCGAPTLWNKTGVELCCTNPNCDGIAIAKIVHFFSTIGCDEIGEETFYKMYSSGFKTIKSILNITEEDLLLIDGFGPAIASIIIANNKRIKEGVDMPTIMHASDCFEGIGRIKSRDILNKLDSKSKSEFYDMKFYVDKAPDSANKTWQSFYNGLSLFYRFIADNGLKIVEPEEVTVDINGTYSGMSVSFSGIRDSNVENDIISKGGKVVSGVSKNTTHLVVKDLSAASSKIEKAKEIGIPIYNMEAFLSAFK